MSQDSRGTPVVSLVPCGTYDLGAVRQAVTAVLDPLGGIDRFVRPGMQVLLKPNLLLACDLERAVTTHPALVQIVAELVQRAGATAVIGDSPAGSVAHAPAVWQRSGMADVASNTGARIAAFDGVTWKRLGNDDYFIARPVFEADLVINLPKLKTHTFSLYSGAVKNMFGVIPGLRKREVHYRYPGVRDFTRALVDVLELATPGLTIMDGVMGLEGDGPGIGGTPRRYGCLVASVDPVALDTVITQWMGYRPGEVLHIQEAGSRALGVSNPEAVRVIKDGMGPGFSGVRLPGSRWYFSAPAWAGAPLQRIAQGRPRVVATACTGCGRCAEICPREAITPGRPPVFDLERCVGCFCCAEVCPQGAVEPKHGLLARLLGMGGP